MIEFLLGINIGFILGYGIKYFNEKRKQRPQKPEGMEFGKTSIREGGNDNDKST